MDTGNNLYINSYSSQQYGASTSHTGEERSDTILNYAPEMKTEPPDSTKINTAATSIKEEPLDGDKLINAATSIKKEQPIKFGVNGTSCGDVLELKRVTIKEEPQKPQYDDEEGTLDQPMHENESLRKLFIGGLDFSTDEGTLKSYFGKYGEIIDCCVIRNYGKNSKGFGFVTFSKSSMADQVQKERYHKLDGRTVEAKRAVPREKNGNVNTNKVFLGGVKDNLEAQDLEKYFSQFGSVVRAVVMTDKEGRRRGFAFITMEDTDAVNNICLVKTHFIKNNRCGAKKCISKEGINEAKAKQRRRRGDILGGGMGDRCGSRSGMGGGLDDPGGDGNFENNHEDNHFSGFCGNRDGIMGGGMVNRENEWDWNNCGGDDNFGGGMNSGGDNWGNRCGNDNFGGMNRGGDSSFGGGNDRGFYRGNDNCNMGGNNQGGMDGNVGFNHCAGNFGGNNFGDNDRGNFGGNNESFNKQGGMGGNVGFNQGAGNFGGNYFGGNDRGTFSGNDRGNFGGNNSGNSEFSGMVGGNFGNQAVVERSNSNVGLGHSGNDFGGSASQDGNFGGDGDLEFSGNQGGFSGNQGGPSDCGNNNFGGGGINQDFSGYRNSGTGMGGGNYDNGFSGRNMDMDSSNRGGFNDGNQGVSMGGSDWNQSSNCGGSNFGSKYQSDFHGGPMKGSSSCNFISRASGPYGGSGGFGGGSFGGGSGNSTSSYCSQR